MLLRAAGAEFLVSIFGVRHNDSTVDDGRSFLALTLRTVLESDGLWEGGIAAYGELETAEIVEHGHLPNLAMTLETHSPQM